MLASLTLSVDAFLVPSLAHGISRLPRPALRSVTSGALKLQAGMGKRPDPTVSRILLNAFCHASYVRVAGSILTVPCTVDAPNVIVSVCTGAYPHAIKKEFPVANVLILTYACVRRVYDTERVPRL